MEIVAIEQRSTKDKYNVICRDAEDLLYWMKYWNHELDDDNFYGARKIYPHSNLSEWPQMLKVPIISNRADGTLSVTQYLNDVFKDMAEQYIAYDIEQGNSETYDDVRHKGIIFDTMKFSKNYVKTDEDERAINNKEHVSRTDWSVFCPDEEWMTIRTDQNEYLRIHVLERNMKTKTIRVDVKHYAGNANQWICYSGTEFLIAFQPKKILGCEWSCTNAFHIAEYVSRHIDKMNWSKEKKTMWKDRYDIYPPDEIYDIGIQINYDFLSQLDVRDDVRSDIEDMKDHIVIITVHGKENKDRLMRTQFIAACKILRSGKDVIKVQHERLSNNVIREYMQYMALYREYQFWKESKEDSA